VVVHLTGLQLLDYTNGFTGGSMSNTQLLRGVNEFLAWLASEMRVTDTTTQVAVADTWYTLPANLIGIDRIENDEGAIVTGYTVEGDQIRFVESDTFTIYAKKTPDVYVDVNLQPNVHVAYHPSLLEYLKAYWFLIQDPNSQAGQRLKTEAYAMAKEAEHKLKRRTHPKQIMVMRHA
jgi:hypothetical protein